MPKRLTNLLSKKLFSSIQSGFRCIAWNSTRRTNVVDNVPHKQTAIDQREVPRLGTLMRIASEANDEIRTQLPCAYTRSGGLLA